MSRSVYATALLLVALIATLMTSLAAAQPDNTDPSANANRFIPVDVLVDAGDKHLAAWQVHLLATAGDVSIVGIEGGEHPAYAESPYYDPKAMMDDRVILAAFSTSENLPTGITRIARLHIRVTGNEKPELGALLPVAIDTDGNPINATVAVTIGESR